ncbi:hypothetical protein KOW79_001514 [Hemibagrus wyckioides]|uniref:Uncharacterized protein n=1 Tax=Hemibagrus wyckioides TaxID=337641 RepID=A0A9D3P8Q9_9TELE|nr:uncharacterized protein si:dkey-96g2.1 [Hemibagrus wyckioides]KAG7334918.1 hypothetical protein KOW79_001514 [Hemibagrus wyckioides]
MGSLKGLIVLCLLDLCVQSIQGDVKPAAIAKIIQYFADNVQPQTDKGQPSQYAFAITVPNAQCTSEQSDIQTVFSKKEAEYVKSVISKGDTCILCSQSGLELGIVIATRPNRITKEHSEHILLYPLGNSPMDKLLAKADQNSCIVFYSYNSPCVKKCIKSEDNILDGLSNWKNIRKDAMNVFVFEKIWPKDARKKDMAENLMKIHDQVPLYRCNNTNGMECRNCVEKNTRNVIPFCLSV